MEYNSCENIQDKLELILESTNIATWDWYVQVDRAMWDDSCFTMLGYEPKEFIINYKKWLTLLHPEDKEISDKRVQKGIEKKGAFALEFRLLKKDGSWLWIEGRGKVVEYDDKGQPLRISGVHINIDDKKRAELRAKEQETIFQEVFETAPVGITITDPIGNIVNCNKASEKLLGITKEEHLARNYEGKYWKIIRPDGNEMPSNEYASVRALEDRKVIKDQQMGIVKNDGTITWLSVSAAPSDNSDIGVVISYKDITIEKEVTAQLKIRIEEELALKQRSENRYKTIFENSPEGVLLIDKTGKFIDCNSAAAKIIDTTPENIIGKTIADISPVKQKEMNSMTKGFSYIEKALSGEIVQFEWIHNDVHDNELIIEVQLAPYSIDSENLIVFWRDLTQMKDLQKEKVAQDALLIQQSKLAEMGEMVGAIAHQWKQPINSIFILTDSIVDMIEYEELTEESAIDVTKSIKKQAKFMSQTIDDFRRFLIPSSEKQKFFIGSNILEILRLLKYQFVRHNIEFNVDSKDDFVLLGYPNELKQVFLNIFKNCSDAFCDKSMDNKIIDITTSLEGDVGVIKVQDNAGGVDEALLPDKLFENYVTTKGDKGTGIGLQLVKKIVTERFSGTVKAYNKNGGACFEISIPMCKG